MQENLPNKPVIPYYMRLYPYWLSDFKNLSVFIKMGILGGFFFIAAIGTAMALHSILLLTQGQTVNSMIVESEPARNCLVPPNFRCTYTTLAFKTSSGQTTTFKQDLNFDPVAVSVIPTQYLKDYPKIAAITSKLIYTFLSGFIITITGWIVIKFLHPLKTILEFDRTFRFGWLPLFYPFTTGFLQSKPVKIISAFLVLIMFSLLLWRLVLGEAVGIIWTPLLTLIILRNFAYYGLPKISDLFFSICLILLTIFLYFLLVYQLIIA